MKYKKLKLILLLSHCFILTPVLLIRNLTTFDIIESRIFKNHKITKNINLPNCVIEYTGVESHSDGTLLCINDQLAYKPRTDMNIYKFCELESIFIEIISKEKKTIFVLGDFNINLLKHEKHNPTNEFLYSLSSNMFLPYILHPTKIHRQSRILTDNIFINQ